MYFASQLNSIKYILLEVLAEAEVSTVKKSA